MRRGLNGELLDAQTAAVEKAASSSAVFEGDAVLAEKNSEFFDLEIAEDVAVPIEGRRRILTGNFFQHSARLGIVPDFTLLIIDAVFSKEIDGPLAVGTAFLDVEDRVV